MSKLKDNLIDEPQEKPSMSFWELMARQKYLFHKKQRGENVDEELNQINEQLWQLN